MYTVLYLGHFIKEPYTIVHLLSGFNQESFILSLESAPIACQLTLSVQNVTPELTFSFHNSMSGIRVICIIDFILHSCHMNTPWCCTDAGVRGGLSPPKSLKGCTSEPKKLVHCTVTISYGGSELRRSSSKTLSSFS